MFDGVFFGVYQLINTKVFSYIVLITKGFMEGFAILERSAVILYLIVMGYGWMMGKYKEASKDILVSMIIVCFIQVFLFETRQYLDCIQWGHGWIHSFGSWFIDQGQGGPNAMFQIMEQFASHMAIVTSGLAPDEGGFFSDKTAMIKSYTGILLLGLASTALFMIYLIQLVIANLKILILFTVGFVPIFFSSFKQTRTFFYAWLRQLVCASLTFVFTCMMMGMFAHICNDAMSELVVQVNKGYGVFTKQYWVTMLLCIFTWVLLRQAPALAAHLTGSMSSDDGQVAGELSNRAAAATYKYSGSQAAVGKGKEYGGKGAKWMGKRALEGLGNTYSKYKGLGN